MRSIELRRLIVPAAAALGMVFATAAAFPAVRCQAINGVIWVAARTVPRHLAALHQAMDPLYPAGAVVLVGDSLISQLPSRWVESRALNLGIGGIGVAGVHANLRGLSSLNTAKALVLLVGTNDVVGQRSLPAEIVPEMERLLAALPPELPVILCAVPPTDPSVHWVRKPAVIQALNVQLKSAVRSRPHTQWVDLHTLLADSQGRLPSAFHQGDGLHLAAGGNRIVAAAIKAALPDAPAP
jgi:lysophospholipase L1-like esterase